jgi:predicted nucleic acid-binding protein
MPFLLDTNVISELRKGSRCHAHVWTWYDSTPLDEIYLSVLALGEMRRGVEKKRKHDPITARVYEKWLNEVVLTYGRRILPVTAEISEIWGALGASEQISPIDAIIAATAVRYNLTVATRNERDFQRVGVDYYNPFTGGQP